MWQVETASPNLVYRSRWLMLEGGSVAVTGDDNVTSNREVREMESRIRELERQLGRKTLEVEILKEALDRPRPRSDLAVALIETVLATRLLRGSFSRITGRATPVKYAAAAINVSAT